MTSMNRRTFVRVAATAAGAMAIGGVARPVWARPIGANEAVRVAVIGFNRKGAALIRQLAEMPGVRIAALCDVDPQILAREVELLKAERIDVFATTDAREIMSRDDVDAVVIATCNHWHALLTVWACQAGKDVYVEKPVSHTMGESRKMIEAARKYGRVVQTGSQLRSDTGLAEAVRYVREGNLGEVQWIRGVCYTRRDSIGLRPPWYPKNLDYDLWCGPAPVTPLERTDLHYDWHWDWSTGNGDMANIGAHVMDMARRFLDEGASPRRIASLGGRYGHRDAGRTPNTQLALFDYPGTPVLFETRGLPARAGVTYMDQLRGIRTGVVVQCEEGAYAGYIGGSIFDRTGKLVKRIPGDGGAGHMRNFIDAVRSRDMRSLAAPIETGVAAADLCHAANVSYRLGRTATVTETKEKLADFPLAGEAFARIEEHLAVHEVDLGRQPPVVGPWVAPKGGSELSLSEESGAAEAALLERFVRGAQRPPYVIPESV